MDRTTIPIAVLRCPVSGQELSWGDDDVLKQLQKSARNGSLRTFANQPVTSDFDAVLVREDRQFAYLVKSGIPDLLPGSRIAL